MLQVYISNDDGLTVSYDPQILYLAAQVPRLLALESPRQLFAGVKADLVISGVDLGVLGQRITLAIRPLD